MCESGKDEQIAKLRHENATLQEKVWELGELLDSYKEQNELFRKAIFGSSSEKFSTAKPKNKSNEEAEASSGLKANAEDVVKDGEPDPGPGFCRKNEASWYDHLHHLATCRHRWTNNDQFQRKALSKGHPVNLYSLVLGLQIELSRH